MPETKTPLDEQLLTSAVGALEIYGVFLGRKLGLYEAIAEKGPVTESELATTAGVAPRYAREWLEQQAVAGYVSVADDPGEAADRRYELSEEQKAVLVRADDPAHVSPMAPMIAGIGAVLGDVVEAYRSGAGVPFARYGEDLRQGQGGINRPAFTHDLTESWIPAIGDTHRKLEEGSGRVADLGCGQGWSAIAMASAYPTAEVIGIDADTESIQEAERIATQAGVEVGFVPGDADAIADQGPFDLVTVLEVLHDLARPVETLEAARRSLAPGGVVLIADEKVADSFHAPGDLLERMMYGWSITHCLPSSLAEQPSAALGTVLRASRVQELAAESGFATCDALDVDAGFFRLYLLA